MTGRPLAVRVVGKRHQIMWDQDLEERFGDYEEATSTIRIAKGVSLDESRETLLHEIMHALENQMGIVIAEKKLRQLSIGLYAVLRDNPLLVEFMTAYEGQDGRT